MPTGYTSRVADGEVTEFREFAWACARAFGALVLMRDDDVDAPIAISGEVGEYYVSRVQKAEKELARLEALSLDDFKPEHAAKFQAAIERHKEDAERRAAIKVRYDAMLAKVRAWQPPSDDHDNMKKFMIQQLEESIRHDCNYGYEVPQPEAVERAYTKTIQAAKREVGYAKRNLREEQDRVAGRNLWLKQLQDSVGNPPRME